MCEVHLSLEDVMCVYRFDTTACTSVFALGKAMTSILLRYRYLDTNCVIEYFQNLHQELTTGRELALQKNKNLLRTDTCHCHQPVCALTFGKLLETYTPRVAACKEVNIMAVEMDELLQPEILVDELILYLINLINVITAGINAYHKKKKLQKNPL